MPFAKCPICGNDAHVNVVDIESWYRDNFPDVPYMTTVPAVCSACYSDLVVGDVVEIRQHLSNHPDWSAPGTRGTIARIATCERGNIYFLEIEGGKDDVFIRSELRKPRRKS